MQNGPLDHIPQSHIRNFSIIAHIDHGKSTLADRILQMTSAVADRDMKEQMLDSMDLERERGITIKASAVRLDYTAKDGQRYVLNLIDTPGHVDFTYEVSRALAACEGALLIVDASQGVEAQTVANAHLAIMNDLEIIPVLNKIDLPGADPNRVIAEIEEIVGLPGDEALLASGKSGIGVLEILEAIVERVPAPVGDSAAPLQALIFDSNYDAFRGVIIYVRVKEGTLKSGQKIEMMGGSETYQISELGVFRPKMTPVKELRAGESGYIISGIKDVADVRIGDTVTDPARPAKGALPGYREPKPMVFCGLYPINSDDFPDLRDALDKLRLNDASLVYLAESSPALGFGFRCGFLGLLHMDIVQERLEREYNLSLIATAPSCVYRLTRTNGEVFEIENPSKMPSPTEIQKVEEPMVDCTVLVPKEYVGPVLELCTAKRGIHKGMDFAASGRVTIKYLLPLSEMIMDFFDQLKSRTRGYASMDYEIEGYQVAPLVKVDILVNGESVDALSFICHRDQSQNRGRQICEKMKELIDRQMFAIKIQAAIGSKILASEQLSAMRKDVTAKCYGGDISRKRKLLEKQKEGKKRMKSVGNVDIPQEAFLSILKVSD
ncbi:GTP-binding protein LepA [Abditibacterium utsteinense]|uniref:Elongation factor 4 n=1 Tax=Abditibacterium utsteinense TaxID=1960156 RepID=A0A2S8SWF0_9BACT|nr:translation elongation factor 4 [Abditibacterium utsteinense]PQV65128.1 GTP-binding protein LepA [Abditibacterium utsteinense]